MKKKVAFQKEIEFPTMIGEISAISLEHDLHFIDESNVEGSLLLTGKYKLTEASRLEEDFSYKIPTEIALTEMIDLNTAKIEIIDFYYEIKNDDTMICNIELELEGVEIIEVESDDDMRTSVEEERECDGDDKEMKEIEIPRIEKEIAYQEEEIKQKKQQEIEIIEEQEKVQETKEKPLSPHAFSIHMRKKKRRIERPFFFLIFFFKV